MTACSGCRDGDALDFDFSMAFQPIVNVRDKTVFAYEALARGVLGEPACTVLDEEVADKGGLTGIAIKGAYKIVQGIRPGFVRHTVNNLLDDFLDAVDPIYQEAAQKKTPAGAYLKQNTSRVAQALLAVVAVSRAFIFYFQCYCVRGEMQPDGRAFRARNISSR